MALKVKEEHIETLRMLLQPYLNTQRAAEYAARGMTPRRYRWDALWAAGRKTTLVAAVVREIYEYANDDHLDSVLKLLAKEGETR